MTNKEIAKKTEVAVDQETVDRYLWRFIGKQPVKWIAENLNAEYGTNYSPSDVLRMVQENLERVDVLTVRQKQQRILMQLQENSEMAQERIRRIGDKIEDREYAQILNASTNALNASLRELARLGKEDNTQIEQLNSLRVRELLRLMDRVVTSGVKEISEAYGIDEYELSQVFQDKLVESAGEME